MTTTLVLVPRTEQEIISYAARHCDRPLDVVIGQGQVVSSNANNPLKEYSIEVRLQIDSFSVTLHDYREILDGSESQLQRRIYPRAMQHAMECAFALSLTGFYTTLNGGSLEDALNQLHEPKH